jgi:hypothetical protein
MATRREVLDNSDGSSSLAASMFMIVELLKGWVNAVTANGVHWGSRSALVAIVLHFWELKSELELLGSRHHANLTKNVVDGLRTQVHVTSDSLASYVPLSVACGPHDGVGE